MSKAPTNNVVFHSPYKSSNAYDVLYIRTTQKVCWYTERIGKVIVASCTPIWTLSLSGVLPLPRLQPRSLKRGLAAGSLRRRWSSTTMKRKCTGSCHDSSWGDAYTYLPRAKHCLSQKFLKTVQKKTSPPASCSPSVMEFTQEGRVGVCMHSLFPPRFVTKTTVWFADGIHRVIQYPLSSVRNNINERGRLGLQLHSLATWLHLSIATASVCRPKTVNNPFL